MSKSYDVIGKLEMKGIQLILKNFNSFNCSEFCNYDIMNVTDLDYGVS